MGNFHVPLDVPLDTTIATELQIFVTDWSTQQVPLAA
jgi:hypothetical protein